MNGFSKVLIWAIFLLLGVGVYFGLSTYMINQYQLDAKSGHLIGLVSAGIFYLFCIIASILTKSVPKLYETHGVSEDDNQTDKDKN